MEGRWAVEALLQTTWDVVEVVSEEGRHLPLADEVRRRGIPHREETRQQVSQERGYAFHRGIYATVVRPVSRPPEEEFLKTASRLVVPLGLADPGNLGTILRSAVAFGVDGIILEKGRGADVYNSKCIRSSATAIFRVPIFEVTSLESSIPEWKRAGFVAYGTSLRPGAVALSEVEPAGKSCILLGSEEEGLPPNVEELCDERIHIPMANDIDSLNVGSSAAIVFYELFGSADAR